MFQLSLWEIIEPIRRALTRSRPRPAKPRRPAPPARPKKPAARDRYDAIVQAKLDQYQIRVRKWRASMSGLAWQNTYRDGSVRRFLESPRPKTPLSLSIFLHEVGHHHIGFGTHKPRCLEEYHAWMYALAEMDRLGVPITPRVRRRVDQSLRYAVAKARRRGIKEVPGELTPWTGHGPTQTPANASVRTS